MNRLTVKKPLAITSPYGLASAASTSTWYHCGSKRWAKASISARSTSTTPRSTTVPGVRSSKCRRSADGTEAAARIGGPRRHEHVGIDIDLGHDQLGFDLGVERGGQLHELVRLGLLED